MGNSEIRLGKTVIYNPDDITLSFLEQWNDDQDYIIAQTSGSTGIPKTIKLKKNDMLQSAIATCHKFEISEISKLVSPLSTEYIAGKMMIVRAICSGAKLFLEKPSSNPITNDYGKIDLLPIVPSQIDGLLKSPCCDNITNVIVGGGAMTREAEQRLRNSGIKNVYATYGMTETCSHVALRNISDIENIYTAMPDISFSVDNKNCLIIHLPKYTSKLVTTNDIVKLVDNTHFKWIGRWDNVINTGGVKVFPEQIEIELADIISQPYYIIGVPDQKWGEAVTLYIETSSEIDIDILQSIIRNRISNPYYMPKKIICINKFDRTISGKIKRIIY